MKHQTLNVKHYEVASGPEARRIAAGERPLSDCHRFCFGSFVFGAARKMTGFTLLETVVALALIVTAMSGPFTLATRAIFAAKFSRSKLIALNLAQEGVELVRHMRANNVLNGFDWRGLAGSCTGSCTRLQSGDYQPDVYTLANGSTPPICSLTGGTCTPLRYDISGLYNQSAGTPSSFTRIISLATVSESRMRVTATVTWLEGGISRRVELREEMYNWQ
jgi:type II secretory pathway pseudopilin PulG